MDHTPPAADVPVALKQSLFNSNSGELATQLVGFTSNKNMLKLAVCALYALTLLMMPPLTPIGTSSTEYVLSPGEANA